jgi:bifunctional non-homologous end joining protein LigD
MLATAGRVPEGPGWAYEFKWDGVRAILGAAPGGPVRAHSRNEREITRSYPELRALAQLVDERVLLDGELVVLDESGRPSFHLLQHRMHVQAPTAMLLQRLPVELFVFDVLHHAGRSLLSMPYIERRQLLAELELERDGLVRTPPHYTDLAGAELLEIARENSLEGIIAKRTLSIYQPGRRTQAWIKTPLRETQDVIVGGWTYGEGRRTGTFGALLIGVHDETDGRFRFVGHVGTGFDNRALADMQARLEALARESSPFDEEVPREDARRARWVDPVLVGEVEHRQWTVENRLRHPSWRGLRPDREPQEVRGQFFSVGRTRSVASAPPCSASPRAAAHRPETRR